MARLKRHCITPKYMAQGSQEQSLNPLLRMGGGGGGGGGSNYAALTVNMDLASPKYCRTGKLLIDN